MVQRMTWHVWVRRIESIDSTEWTEMSWHSVIGTPIQSITDAKIIDRRILKITQKFEAKFEE
ncbi:hypothetical protein BOC58_24520 [Burkholderia pseudomallei]|nr:hypothetical protein BOC58_24520 [Burkholderia pseudomallei]